MFLMAMVVMAHASINDPIPEQYQKNTTVKLVTMTQEEINKTCGVSPGFDTIACADIGGKHIFAPNACLYPEAKDVNSYAHMICHETAHTEGWDHGD